MRAKFIISNQREKSLFLQRSAAVFPANFALYDVTSAHELPQVVVVRAWREVALQRVYEVFQVLEVATAFSFRLANQPCHRRNIARLDNQYRLKFTCMDVLYLKVVEYQRLFALLNNFVFFPNYLINIMFYSYERKKKL